MNRRELLLCGVGAVVACSTGCEPEGPDFAPEELVFPEQVMFPSDPHLRVVSWVQWGGMADVAGESPRLAVYADGTVIAQADRQLMLNGGELAELVAVVRAGVQRGSTLSLDCMALDGSATDLGVLGADGVMRKVTGCDLDRGRKRLKVAYESVQALARRCLDTGKPYVAPRIRLKAWQGTGGDQPLWPQWLAVPAKFPADLDGFTAQRVIVELSVAYTPHGGPVLDLMVPGRSYNLALGWRYRLPDE